MKNPTLPNLQIIITIFFILAPFMITAQTITVSGDITADTIWAADTVKVTGDISINPMVTLTIKPGVVVQFQDHYEINVEGTLDAIGNSDSMILFTVKDTTGFSNYESDSGSWRGILYYNYPLGVVQGNPSDFEYCIFEYSKAIGEYPDGQGGALMIVWYDNININHCEFRNNLANEQGGAIYATINACPEISNCLFENNIAQVGGAICINQQGIADGTFINNTFYKNLARTDGGALYLINTSVSLVNNHFYNNRAISNGGAICISESYEILEGNIIANNTANMGGGLYIHAAWPDVYNNTICFNDAEDTGGGISFHGIYNSDFRNNIIWGNTGRIGGPGGTVEFNQIIINTVTSQPNFYNCIIQDGLAGFSLVPGVTFNGVYSETVDQNPLFGNAPDSSGIGYDALTADWSLYDSSAAINGGNNSVENILISATDSWGNPRIHHGIIDIGAYEAHIPEISTGDTTIATNTRWIADTVRIGGDIHIKDSVVLDIAPGCYIKFQGNYKLDVQGTLKAIGKEQSPITFSVHDTTGFSDTDTTLGGWYGIVFDNSHYGANNIMTDNDTSVIRYCILEYAKGHNPFWMPEFIQGGAIKVRYFSNLVIDRCTIQYSQGLWGGGISLDMFSDPVISNNIIYKNLSTSGGGINCMGSSNPMILNNIIINNKSISGNGGGIYLENSSPVIRNNVMCNNYSGNSGGGIHFQQSNAKFLNNTVCNNFSPLGPGIGTWACSPVIYNSIIYGNRDGSADNIQQCRTFPDNDYYYNNIEGGIRGISFPWGEHQGIHIGIIDTPPFFKNPTSGAGLEYDALHADWSLTDLSPNINRGTIDTSGLNLPATDIAGNRRIHYNRVDIGAYENQSYPVVIIKQPANNILCVGDSTSFTIQVNGTATYQWYKNNDSIAGAVDSILTINPAGLVDEANYYCMVTNGYGPVQSNNVFLVVKTHPKILIEPENQWVDMNKPLKLRMTVDGTAPISYQWLKDSIELQGENLPELNLAAPTFDDEGVYNCVVSNACSEVMTDPIVIYMAPQICMVTVDRITGNNLVVWEKNSIAPISQYNIYRESKYAGIYDLLTTVPYDQLSIYNDSTADPTSRAYLYKITAIDTSGFETDLDLCTTHKTIHLLITMNPETKATQLDWDHYVGFVYGTYEILRSDTTINFLTVDEMSSSTSTWSDPDPGTDTKYYRIAALRPVPCYPTGTTSKKAESGPYSHSMSNMENNRFDTTSYVNDILAYTLNVYPNPSNETTTLTFNNLQGHPYTLYITDLSGKVCRIVNDITTSEYVLEKGNLKEGMYFVELRGKKIYRGKIVIE